MQVVVYPDAGSLASGAATYIGELLGSAEGPRVSLGLAGGSAPHATYAELVGQQIAWDRVDAWLADERWVPKDHHESNGRMASTTLFRHVAATLHRPRWAPWLEPADSAAHYEALLRSLHPSDHRPDLILLGMGEDGHTASLFPGREFTTTRRWYVATESPAGKARLSSTLTLLHLARRILFLVIGEGKAEVLARVLEKGDDLPARRVMEGPAEVTWLVDEAAASGLRSTELNRAQP
jgi:6-phosphogluconolactonase